MTINLDDVAAEIVFQLLGPGCREEFAERLPNRPNWQQSIEYVRDQLGQVVDAAAACA